MKKNCLDISKNINKKMRSIFLHLTLEKLVGLQFLAQAINFIVLKRLINYGKLNFFQRTRKPMACSIIQRPTDLSGIIRILVFYGFISHASVSYAYPDECLGLTAPAVFLESSNIVCLPKVAVLDNSGTQMYKASLQWLGGANPFKYLLLSAELGAESGVEDSVSYSAETGELTIPKVDIPRTYGTERYAANLVFRPENNTSLFELSTADIYINPDHVPNETWVPYGMLSPDQRRAVILLGQSTDYAKLADAVYDFGNDLPDNWTLIDTESKDSGMQAGVYSNQITNEIVLVFRGTETCDFPCSFDESKESLLDIAADGLLALGESSSQFRHALEYAQQVVSMYPDNNIIVVGHSLGGALAQAVGVTLELKTFAFNSAPVPDDFIDDHPIELTVELLKDLVHVIADIHDPVSNTDDSGESYLNAIHISPLIQFDFNEKEILPDQLEELDDLRFNKHSMSSLIENSTEVLRIYKEGW